MLIAGMGRPQPLQSEPSQGWQPVPLTRGSTHCWRARPFATRRFQAQPTGPTWLLP